MCSQFSDSISKIYLTFEIINKGVAFAEIIRFLAPLTINKILKHIPLENRIFSLKEEMAYCEIGIEIGSEKQKTSFKRGDIVFLPANNAICIFLKDATTKPMNPLGKIVKNLELFDNIQAGSSLKIMRNSK